MFFSNAHFNVVQTKTEIKVMFNNQVEIFQKKSFQISEVFFESDSLIIITSNYNESIRLQSFNLFYKDKNTERTNFKSFSNINFEKNKGSNFRILKKDNLFCLYEKSVLIDQTESIELCEQWIVSNLIER